MAQVTYEDKNYVGEISFTIEITFDGSFERKKIFTTFDELNYYLEHYYNRNYKELFDEDGIFQVYFVGISFRGQQESERFAIDVTEGWKRATIIFDESKFGDINVEKLKRIKEILAE